jgi:hypothetical protein
LDKEKKPWVWIFGIMALLINLLIPIRLDRETWQTVDEVAAGILGISTFIIKERK